MYREELKLALNGALRDKLTLVNKGFVQALNLRFKNASEYAELAYADNLAETKRLMQFTREMQRLGIALEPDRLSGGAERAAPDLQANVTEVWLSDLKLANNSLAFLLEARKVIRATNANPLDFFWLDQLIQETTQFAGELESRSHGVYSFQAGDRTLEHFLQGVDGLDERLLVGKVEVKPAESKSLLVILNTVLHNQFVAIEQFFLQGFALENYGYKAMGESRIRHSLEEMCGAFRTVQHILLLGSVPSSETHLRFRIPYRVMVGPDVESAIKYDLELTKKLMRNLVQAEIWAKTRSSQPDTHELVSFFTRIEEIRVKDLYGQLETFLESGEDSVVNGQFDTMLTRWAVT